MSTEELIERFIEAGVKAFKIILKGTEKYDRLNRHETVVVAGQEVNYWREYGVYTMALYLRELVPECDIDCCLDGNDSTLKVELTEEQQILLDGSLNDFLKKNRVIKGD